MGIHYLFPIGAISDIGNRKTICGSFTISAEKHKISKTVNFELTTQTWQDHTPDLDVDIEFPEDFLYDSEIEFSLTADLPDADSILIVFGPTVTNTHQLDTYILPVEQTVVNTDFRHEKIWFNLPLKNNQLGKATLRTYIEESTKTIHPSLIDKITVRKTLTYIEKPPTKENLSIDENIEYFLGKDHLKNLYFNPCIPTAWSIPARIKTSAPIIKASTVGFFPGDSIKYTYNNLGYRSHFDYALEELKDKHIVLCLGDSDTFGVGVEYDQIWPMLIDTDAIVLNLSIPGISNDGMARVAAQAIHALGNSISTVLAHYPPMSLREFVSKKYKGGVHTHRNYYLPYNDWWNHIDWQSNNYNFNKNKLLLENTCAKFDIELHDLYINRNDTNVPYDFVEYGVYNSIGPHTHQAIANYFNRKLNGDLSLYKTMQS